MDRTICGGQWRRGRDGHNNKGARLGFICEMKKMRLESRRKNKRISKGSGMKIMV